MEVFRFMSKEEFEKYKKGEKLENKTIHRAKTNSIGFYFLNIKECKPKEAIHFLSGVVSFDVCAVFEVNKELYKGYGVYAKPIRREKDPIKDFINILNGHTDKIKITEYSTTEYDNKTMKLLKYSTNIWRQWNPIEEQSKLKWIKEK